MKAILQSGWFRWGRRVLSILFALSALGWLLLWVAIQLGFEIENPERWSRLTRALWQAGLAWWLWPSSDGAGSFDDEEWVALLYSEVPELDLDKFAELGAAKYGWRLRSVNSFAEVPPDCGDQEIYYVDDDHVWILVIGGVVYGIRGGDEPLSEDPEDLTVLTDLVEDLRLASAIRGHRAALWIEVDDLRGHGAEGTFATKCRIASLIASEDLVVLGVPACFILVPASPELLDHLPEVRSPGDLEDFQVPPVVRIPIDDEEMEAAIEEARRHLGDFDAAFRKRGNEDIYQVKFPLATEQEPENIWLQVEEIREDSYHGLLANEPVHGRHVLGDALVVPRDQVIDWMYVQDGETIGARTCYRFAEGDGGRRGD